VYATELSNLSLLAFHGPDSAKFLQGQITCDIHKVTGTQSSLGAHCNLKGRMQSLFRLWYCEKTATYYMNLPDSMLEPTFKDFKKYSLFSKVTIADKTAEFQRMAFWGDDCQHLLLNALNISDMNFITNQTLTMVDGDEFCTLVCISENAPRFEFIATKGFKPDVIQRLLQQSSAATLNDWQVNEIESGIPAVYPETIDQILPHHVNLVELNGISFDKGCYLGQEIIARMQWRGKVKKHMRMATVATDVMPKAGDPVFAENSTENDAPGVVVRAAQKDAGSYVILAVLDDGDEVWRLGDRDGAVLQ
jgi:tRNA-modifying protein YgfZ